MWVVNKTKEAFGKNPYHNNQISDAPGKQELLRIKQAIHRASSTHQNLSIDFPYESAESSVKKLISECNRVREQYFSVRKDLRAETAEKERALNWVASKDKEIEREREENQKSIQALLKNHSENLASLKLRHEQELKVLKMKHELENASLKEVIEEFKSDMYGQKEHAKGLTDHDISSNFMKLSTDIEEFSRLGWDASLETRWPYPEEKLKLIHQRSIRLLKQHIIQNFLWFALNEFIFRTPFRIMGEYGERFDSRVYEAHSSEFENMDMAEAEALNLKRYKNSEVFLAAIKSDGTSSARNIEILHSYESARGTALDSICKTLSKVTQLDALDSGQLDEILKAAVEMWLEACSQTYRLFVIIPERCIDVMRFPRNAYPISLVVRPELRRYGSVQGTDLLKGESLAGWKHEIAMYPSVILEEAC